MLDSGIWSNCAELVVNFNIRSHSIPAANKSDVAKVQEESLYRANVGPTLGIYKPVWGIFEIQRQNQR